MPKVFISYSRKDGDFAHKMVEALEASGCDTWIDWEDIPPIADWMEQIHKGIEEADAFLFLLSPYSNASPICQQEVEHAAQNNKRLIPVVVNEVNPNDVSPTLGKLNWIFFCRTDSFDTAITKLRVAIETDLIWVEAHRRLQVRALEWERRQSRSLLLRGDDLKKAEEDLAASGQKDPQPTDLQRQFLLESRRAAARTRNLIGVISVIVAIALGIAAFIAILQANQARSEANSRATAEANALFQAATATVAQGQAQQQAATAVANANLAKVGELSALALIKLNDPQNLELAYLLATEGYRRIDIAPSRGALLSVIQFATDHSVGGFLDRPDGTPLSINSYASSPIASIAINPEGTLLAAAQIDGPIALWDLVNREPVGLLKEDGGSPSDISFSPDGKILAAGFDSGNAGIIRIWDVATRTQIGSITVPTDLDSRLTSIALGPNGITAAGFANGLIRLWDTTTLSQVRELTGHTDMVMSVAFGPDGTLLASGGFDNTVRLWDVATGNQIAWHNYNTNKFVRTVVFNSAGTILASGGNDSNVILWDTTNFHVLRQFSGDSSISCIAFSPDDNTLAWADFDFTIHLWHITDPNTASEIIEPLTGHSGPITGIIFSPDSKTLFSGSEDKTIRIWEISVTGIEIDPPLIGHTQRIRSIDYSPDGKTLASGGFDNIIRLWDVTSHTQIAELTGHTNWIESVVFGPTGKTLASAGYDGTIRLWDVATRTQIDQPLTGHTNTVWAVAFSPDGSKLASASQDSTIRLWDVATRTQIGQPITVAPMDSINSVVFSPDGKTLASGGNNGTICLWDVATHAQIGQPITGHISTIWSVAFSPDGTKLASGSSDNTIRLWDVATRTQLGQPLVGHTSMVNSIAFSPDGKTLASGSWDQTIRLWDVASGTPIGRLAQQIYGISNVTFSPGGKTLASGDDTIIHLWNVDPQKWYEAACYIASRNFTRTDWNTYFPSEPYQVTCPQWPAGK